MRPALPERPRWKGFIAAATVITCWTGFNIVSRLGGKSALTPFDMAALRFAVSGVVMLPVFILARNALPLRRLLAIAGSGGLLYALFAYSGFVFAPAAHAGIVVNGGVPLGSALLAWVWLQDRPSTRTFWALGLAATGVALLGISSLGTPHPDTPRAWAGDLCFAVAALLWAAYGLLVRVWHVRPIDAVSGIAVTSAILYLPVYALFLPKGLASASWQDILLQAGYQGIIAALIAAFSYAYATLSLGSGIASLMLAIVPGTSALLAVPLLDEPITAITGLGVLLVTFGAALGALVRKTVPGPTPPVRESG